MLFLQHDVICIGLQEVAEGDAADWEGNDCQSDRINGTLIIVPIIVAACLLCAACAAGVCWRKRMHVDRASKSTEQSKLPDGSETSAACGSGKSNGDERADKGEAAHSHALTLDEDSLSWSNALFADPKKASASDVCTRSRFVTSS